MKSTDEIEGLRAMTVPELAERYEEVYGKPPRIRHKAYLWKRIAWKLQERRFGGLSKVATKKLEELIAEIDLPLDERRARLATRRSTSTACGSRNSVTTHRRTRISGAAAGEAPRPETGTRAD